MTLLAESQEWSKLEYWVGIVWMVWPPRADRMTEEDLDRSMQLLLKQRPTIQKPEQWMERWRQTYDFKDVPETFQRICKQAREAVQQDTP